MVFLYTLSNAVMQIREGSVPSMTHPRRTPRKTRQRSSSVALGGSSACLPDAVRPEGFREHACLLLEDSVVLLLQGHSNFSFASECKQSAHTHLELDEPSPPQADPTMFD